MGGVAWTKEEDNLLKKCIQQYGEGKWHRVPLLAGLNRCRKSCRLRWLNYLRPNIKRGHFSQEEVDLIIKLHKLLGNRWSLIAGRLPGRTANDIKNYWNCHLCKKLNAQETEDDNTAGNVNVMEPQPRNTGTSSSTGFKPPEDESSTSTPVLGIEDTQHQIFLEECYKSKPSMEVYDTAEGSLMPPDIQCEHVRVRGEEDWDDFILDLDLWNDTL
ncbi:hypothetical protein FNV43_RR02840 [Rhamnella rubrinervis]|uniref:Uncharacterized protein n=1 Tax=Rhamnella rubrinervis TaxID=2594499 RepID=A0A8K0MNB8_9ROSA|nr:hypothetical protein FNV43_RR02840 [Rhamnella rubrinervis]